jgi:tetratricopeptide (TPR) repeat protein
MVDRAVAEYEQGLKINPEDPELHFNLGLAMSSRENHSGALKEFGEAIQINPGFAEAHYSLGKTLAVMDKIDWALSEYNEALRNDPGLSAVYFDLGIAFERSGDPEAAIRAYRSFLHDRLFERDAMWELASQRLIGLESAVSTPH